MIWRMTVSALALMGVAQVARAQEAPPPTTPATPTAAANSSDRVVYEAAFFAQYNPQTANDMVRQVPGFSLNGGDDRRGFSGAVGNLLIDGERPITKSQSLEGILGRIPANQVVRIEVLRGAAVAGDASGQSVLLNVVRVPTAGSGVWSAGFEYNRDIIAPQGEASWSGRAGHTEYGIGASYYSQFRDLPGNRRVFDANSVLQQYVDTPSPRNYREASINGNFATSLWGGRLSTTEQLNYWRFHGDNDYLFYTPALVLQEGFFQDFTEHQSSFEIGINYDRPVMGWDMSLVGLINRRYYRNEENDIDLNGGRGLNFSIDQETAQDSGETILRGTLAHDWGRAHHLEFGIEGAHNSLDASLDLVQDDGSGPAPVNIPNANVLVEEDRYEGFVSYTWRPADHWSVDAKVAREQSTLTFTGDTNQTVELAYVKPSIQVSHTFGENNSVHLRYYRDVGQLNFGDFVSASSAADQLINGGNPDLKPQTDWRTELGGDLHFPGGITFSFTYTHHEISDAQDLVPVTVRNPNDADPADPDSDPSDDFITFDAPGNIGDAHGEQLRTTTTLPFGHFWPGAKLTLNTSYYDIQVMDPVTHRERDASGQSNFCTDGEFRDDLSAQQLTWGINFQHCVENQTYRLNETDTSQEGPYVDFFVESTAIPHVKMRATLANTLGSDVRRQRLFFDPDRNGVLDHYEERQRNFRNAPWLILSVSGTF